ncbi:MAG: hypothetical protein H7235_03000, partial [Bdellovibrionaceae bacterium]|nr:hypothetical protein [Pseudobdellovibrionaceae bacterium]
MPGNNSTSLLSTTYFKIFYFLGALIVTGVVFQNCSATGITTQSSSLSGSNYCSGHSADPVCQQSVDKRCNFNSVIVFEGRTVLAYLNSSALAPGTCKAEARRCSGGVLLGSFSYASCAVGAAKSCLFDGKTVASGATVNAFLNSAEPSGGAGCRMEKRTCTDGA